MTVDDLALMIRDALDAAGKTKIPVVPPGTPISVLPAVVLAPADNELDNRVLRYGIDVVVLVPRAGQVAQYELLAELEAIVLQSWYPSTVRLEGPTIFATTGGEGTGEPPAQSRTIPVSFASDVDLC